MKLILNLKILLIGLLFCSCSYKGDIGPLYGQWQLVEYTIDGNKSDINCDNYSITFQYDIVLIKELLGYSDYLNSYGTWTRDGETISLNFTHTDNDGDGGYDPSVALGIPGRAITTMTIQYLSSSNLEFWFINSQGEKLSYKFKKLN